MCVENEYQGVMACDCGKVVKPREHFLTAQATAKHFNSMIAYLVSVSVRNLEPGCTIFHSPSLSVALCSRINLMPMVLMSVHRRVSLPVLK